MVEAVFDLAATPDRLHRFHQSLGPFRRDLGRGTHLAPRVAQTFNVGHLILGMRLVKMLQPFTPHYVVCRGLGNDEHQGIDGPIHSGADCP